MVMSTRGAHVCMDTLEWIEEHSAAATVTAQDIDIALRARGDGRSAAQALLPRLRALREFLAEEDRLFLSIVKEHYGSQPNHPVAADGVLRERIVDHIDAVEDLLLIGANCRDALERLVPELRAWARYEENLLIPFVSDEMGGLFLKEANARLAAAGQPDEYPDLTILDRP